MKKTKQIILKTIIIVSMAICLKMSSFIKLSATNNDTYTSLYYYSNNPSSHSYFNSFIYNQAVTYGINSSNIYSYSHAQENFQAILLTQYPDGITGIRNALVIFDMSAGFLQGSISLDFCEFLYNTFSNMKLNNCKIMFICGTMEIRFSTVGEDYDSEYNSNRFLDYVDIHISVNTDVFYSFYMSMIADIEDETDGYNFSVIFETDNLLRNIYGNLDTESLLFDRFLDYYCRKYNCHEAFINQSGSDNIRVYLDFVLYHLMNNYYINVIRYNSEFDYFIDAYGNMSSNCYIFDLRETVYATSILYDEDNFTEWLSDILDANNNIMDIPFRTYILNYLGLNLEDIATSDIEDLSPLYTAYLFNLSIYGSYIKEAISDFIVGNDLSSYDNWFGRCEVTYKPFSNGEGDWMRAFVYGENGYDFGDISVFAEGNSYDTNIIDWYETI